jgi:hypothetical protein
MAASNRLIARNIILKIDGTEYACDANKVSLTPEDAPGGVRTFCETNTEKQFKLALEGIVSLEATSLYQILWSNQGTQVDFVIAPAGNATPTTNERHYTGSVIIDDLPPLELTAGEGAVFSVTYSVDNATHDPATGWYYGVHVLTA